MSCRGGSVAASAATLSDDKRGYRAIATVAAGSARRNAAIATNSNGYAVAGDCKREGRAVRSTIANAAAAGSASTSAGSDGAAPAASASANYQIFDCGGHQASPLFEGFGNAGLAAQRAGNRGPLILDWR